MRETSARLVRQNESEKEEKEKSKSAKMSLIRQTINRNQLSLRSFVRKRLFNFSTNDEINVIEQFPTKTTKRPPKIVLLTTRKERKKTINLI